MNCTLHNATPAAPFHGKKPLARSVKRFSTRSCQISKTWLELGWSKTGLAGSGFSIKTKEGLSCTTSFLTATSQQGGVLHRISTEQTGADSGLGKDSRMLHMDSVIHPIRQRQEICAFHHHYHEKRLRLFRRFTLSSQPGWRKVWSKTGTILSINYMQPVTKLIDKLQITFPSLITLGASYGSGGHFMCQLSQPLKASRVQNQSIQVKAKLIARSALANSGQRLSRKWKNVAGTSKNDSIDHTVLLTMKLTSQRHCQPCWKEK